jgi:hypothetical protein
MTSRPAATAIKPGGRSRNTGPPGQLAGFNETNILGRRRDRGDRRYRWACLWARLRR